MPFRPVALRRARRHRSGRRRGTPAAAATAATGGAAAAMAADKKQFHHEFWPKLVVKLHFAFQEGTWGWKLRYGDGEACIWVTLGLSGVTLEEIRKGRILADLGDI